MTLNMKGAILISLLSLSAVSTYVHAEDPKCEDYRWVIRNTCRGASWQDGSLASCAAAQMMFASLGCD